MFQISSILDFETIALIELLSFVTCHVAIIDNGCLKLLENGTKPLLSLYNFIFVVDLHPWSGIKAAFSNSLIESLRGACILGSRLILGFESVNLVPEIIDKEEGPNEGVDIKWAVAGHHHIQILEPNHYIFKDVNLLQYNYLEVLTNEIDGITRTYPRWVNKELKFGKFLACHAPTGEKIGQKNTGLEAYKGSFIEWKLEKGVILFLGSQFLSIKYGTKNMLRIICNIVLEEISLK